MRKTLTSSVALITYNGEAFIEEQLKSIIEQTHPPDEIIVSDDASTDETLARVTQIARSSPLPIIILKNRDRLGVTKNIERAVRRCTSDIVFLSDQDDMWLTHKIASYLGYFAKMPHVNAICSDAQLVDVHLRPLGYTLWQTKHYSQKIDIDYNKPVLFRNLLRSNLVCGATLAFRASRVPMIFPIGDGWMHDAWIGALCAGSGSLLMIHTPTILYRQHPKQEIGIYTSGVVKNVHDAIHVKNNAYSAYTLKLNVLQKKLSTQYTSESALCRSELDNAIHHYHTRAKLPRVLLARMSIVLHEVATGNYHKHSSGIASVLKDIFINR